jgi:putative sigma-54 modulation protein
MDIKIQALHFDASEKLKAYIEKKVSKLTRHFDGAAYVDVQLKIVKPQTAMNKEATISMPALGTTIRANKVCDTFEEAIDKCVDVLKVQLEKLKDKRRGE